ncbi:MAG: RNA 3'-terminal phosphate cyclase [Verrucomicrobiota bacterium JB023]|nr:RNA 3'-terminal phosphate cyclase [Verrucomicrobiota bacterium JB023]
MKAIALDGSKGGGQMLRSALTLALITGQAFRMTSIRGQRKSPGLKRQHLTCVKAALALCDGAADGAEMGSTELVFHPGTLRGGDYEFAIGTAGSTSLLLQTLLPALWLAKEPSVIRVSGGTHNPLAPPTDFIAHTFLPSMARLGARATLRLLETGFAPVGGGVIECSVEPCQRFEPAAFTRNGDPESIGIRIIARQVAPRILERVAHAASQKLSGPEPKIEILPEGPGHGLACLTEARWADFRMVCSSFGEQGLTAEKVGRYAGKGMHNYLGSGAYADRHLADQLLLPLALAGGGSFTAQIPDDHFETNRAVISKFVPLEVSVSEPERGVVKVVVGQPD